MTADITEVGLAELLQLPHVRTQVQAEQIGPGRQGGPLLVLVGISLIGLALWGWAEDTLGWSVFALTALGAALTMTGVGLAGGRGVPLLGQQDVDDLPEPLESRPGPDRPSGSD